MKYLKKIVVPLMAISMLLSVCGGEEEVEKEENLTAVQVEELSYGTIKQERTYMGTVEPNETVNVSTKLSGQVENVYFELGDKVNKGDILFTLDKKDIQDQIRQLESQLKVTNASVQSAQVSLDQVNGGQSETTILNYKNAIENAQTALDNAQLTLTTAKASLDDTTTTYERTKTLYEQGVASKSEYDAVELGYTKALNAYEQAQLAYQNSETAYKQAQENYNIYVNKITKENEESAKTGVSAAVASKESIQTQLQIARETLNDTAVRSPITGTISQKSVSASNMVSAASVPYVIVDNSVMKVSVNVSEGIINNISVGQQVDISISAYSDKNVKGTITNVSPIADATGTYPVKIEIANPNGDIKGGMKAELSFVAQENTDAMVVPRDVILENEAGYFVYVIEDNKAVKKDVTVGIDTGKEIEITSGVDLGSQVVVKGQNYLSDGDRVNIVTDEAEQTSEGASAKEE